MQASGEKGRHRRMSGRAVWKKKRSNYNALKQWRNFFFHCKLFLKAFHAGRNIKVEKKLLNLFCRVVYAAASGVCGSVELHSLSLYL